MFDYICHGPSPSSTSGRRVRDSGLIGRLLLATHFFFVVYIGGHSLQGPEASLLVIFWSFLKVVHLHDLEKKAQ